jgi:hypothetical protein
MVSLVPPNGLAFHLRGTGHALHQDPRATAPNRARARCKRWLGGAAKGRLAMPRTVQPDEDEGLLKPVPPEDQGVTTQ